MSEEQEHAEWAEEYEFMCKNPPTDGAYLWTIDKSPIKLEILLETGRPPLIFGRAYVPNTVGVKPEWYAIGINSEVNYGWKAILSPSSRDELIRRRGIRNKFVSVKTLKVLRPSMSGKSLVVEVDDWE